MIRFASRYNSVSLEFFMKLSRNGNRLYAEGFLSFIKGCSLLGLFDRNGTAARKVQVL